MGIEFVVETQLVCVITSSGQILTYDPSTDSTDVVACISARPSACCWSPDQELLILATHDQRLLSFSQSFELLSDKDLNPDESGCGQSVTVGWGSKETQFHGSEGKAAAKEQQVNTGFSQWNE